MLSYRRHRSLSALGFLSLGLSWSCSGDTETQWSFRFDSQTGTSETHVIVTDSPADELEAFQLGIDSLRLHRVDGESAVLLRPASAFRTDLLALGRRDGQRRFEVLAAGAELASGRYDRLSIVLSDPVGLLPDGETLRIDSSSADLPAELEIDLEEAIELRPGHRNYIVIDIDVDRSLVDDDRGVQFRPVVLIESYTDHLPDDSRTVLNLDGEVIEDARAGEGIRVALEGGRGELTVELPPDAAVLDPEGQPIAAGDLLGGQRLTLDGTWNDGGKVSASLLIVDPERAER